MSGEEQALYGGAGKTPVPGMASRYRASQQTQANVDFHQASAVFADLLSLVTATEVDDEILLISACVSGTVSLAGDTRYRLLVDGAPVVGAAVTLAAGAQGGVALRWRHEAPLVGNYIVTLQWAYAGLGEAVIDPATGVESAVLSVERVTS